MVITIVIMPFVRKVATTIQITSEEDREISRMRSRLGLPSKKAVVLEGLKSLRQILKDQGRRKRLQAASLRLRKQSKEVNKEWAPLSSALRHR